MHLLFYCVQKRDDEIPRNLESILEQDSYIKIQTNRDNDYVNLHVIRV